MQFWTLRKKNKEKLQWLKGLRLKVTMQAINGEKETVQCRGELARINRLIGMLYEKGRLA